MITPEPAEAILGRLEAELRPVCDFRCGSGDTPAEWAVRFHESIHGKCHDRALVICWDCWHRLSAQVLGVIERAEGMPLCCGCPINQLRDIVRDLVKL